ncbi:DNA-3-methyladenine glycosylase I [Lactococcus hodotermopsidis]|uniref:DNA-3-methyladenine glycosylase I n=1 Tax=Pseudolactococcus hodotermopsidis TaxID=2709157 RepID=A0A6A0BHR0_9LACT|nr:DNA-3-methyladenine glycosylase I [Lactococcus hodotermopsidis]GFH43337.1 DNA-3-methyladenine glycosylase I [Lactococcus hodotermopsidis]
MKIIEKQRCAWSTGSTSESHYHDTYWGVAVHDDAKLCLDLMQAGLSWSTVLNKTPAFYVAFENFDIVKVGKFDEVKFAELMQNVAIIRNRLKIQAIINNALRVQEIQAEFGSFDCYLWGFVTCQTQVRQPLKNGFLTKNALSDTICKDLKKRGFKFIGTTIIYAYLQAVGVIDDHEETCFRKAELATLRKQKLSKNTTNFVLDDKRK